MDGQWFDDDKNDSKVDKKPVRDIEEIRLKSTSQKLLLIEGVEVYFPYAPYKEQEDYMRQVIIGLKNRQNVLIQSPTGTGKTLCLLCATLGWLRQKRTEQIRAKEKDPVRLIYSSRTHSQLRQVVAELKKTVYNPSITILASRDQYCIKKEFKYIRGQLLISSCMKACKGVDTEQTCSYFKGLHNDPNEVFDGKIQDIEELKIEGKNEGNFEQPRGNQIEDVIQVMRACTGQRKKQKTAGWKILFLFPRSRSDPIGSPNRYD